MQSPDEMYQHYLDWFAEHVKDQGNWSWMRADRDCCNWNDKESPPIPYARGEALFLMSNPTTMRSSLNNKLTSNRNKYNDLSQYIQGDPSKGIINPTYLERFRQGKEFNNSLSKLSIDQASAEMIRLREAQAAPDANYDDELFFARIRKKEPSSTKHTEAPPKVSLASAFFHRLWKWGFPVERFTKKQFSVDVANSLDKESK